GDEVAIYWNNSLGDALGKPVYGSTRYLGDGLYAVYAPQSGSLVHLVGGVAGGTIVVSDDLGGSMSTTFTVDCTDPLIPHDAAAAGSSVFTAQPQKTWLTATAGVALNDVTVATFAVAGTPPDDDFYAQIDWGDGTGGPGTVSFDGSTL